MQVATVGLSITIPLAMVSDYLLFNDIPSAVSFTGASLVLMGFLFVIYHKKEEDTSSAELQGCPDSADDFDACKISTMVGNRENMSRRTIVF